MIVEFLTLILTPAPCPPPSQPDTPTAKRGRLPCARGFRRGLAPARLAPPRYRNEIGKYSVRRASHCTSCGRCVEVCRRGVHVRPKGYRTVIRPFDYRCFGPDCARGRLVLHRRVSAEGPLAVRQSGLRNDGRLPLDARPAGEHLGNGRDRLAAGQAPPERGGPSGGGFDRLRFRFPEGRKREQIYFF